MWLTFIQLYNEIVEDSIFYLDKNDLYFILVKDIK